jgi:hypothetical protein
MELQWQRKLLFARGCVKDVGGTGGMVEIFRSRTEQYWPIYHMEIKAAKPPLPQ